jgi:hypothetical protein
MFVQAIVTLNAASQGVLWSEAQTVLVFTQGLKRLA